MVSRVLCDRSRDCLDSLCPGYAEGGVMSEEYRIRWSVDDGYVGDGPQYTRVKLDDFFDDASVEEIASQIEQSIQEDFEMNIHPSYSMDDVNALASQIHEALRQKPEGK
jgi:plasmid maintenance system killer protein